MTADDIGVEFVEACQEAGHVGFALRSTDSGDVLLIGLSLPPKTVAEMLRLAATAYESSAKPETLN